MAQPANLYSSYDMVGIREDLQDMIYDISPEESPFLSKCAKVTAKNKIHEWQTDRLRAPGPNAHIEGDDTVAQVRTPTTRLANFTQIFKEAVVISGTDHGLDKAGRGREMAREVLRIGKVLKMDIELAMFANTARDLGSNIAARIMAGAGAWVVTNVDLQSGNGGANPTGDGTDARTDDGTPTAFSQTKFNNVMQQCWVSGGKPDTVYLSAAQMEVAQGFVGNNSQRANIDATRNKVVRYMAVYVTPWGSVEFVPSRHVRNRDVWVMQSDMWAVGTFRPMKNEPLAKTGDSEKRQVLTELTMICKNEAASGLVADNS